MNKKSDQKTPISGPAATAPCADEQSWDRLYERIRLIALRKSAALIADADDEPEGFDRGARALRTLMSAAEIARKMKNEDAKENNPDEQEAREPAVTDERIEKLYRSIVRDVERIEQREPGGTGRGENLAGAVSGDGRKTVEDQRP